MLFSAVFAFVLAIVIMFCKKERNPVKNEYKQLKDMAALVTTIPIDPWVSYS